MGGLFRSWGCRVVTGGGEDAVLAGLAAYDHPPDVMISDYHLPGGKTGIEVIERLRSVLSAPVPAFLISGDTDPDALRAARAKGYHLLHKPVEPMALRAMLSQVLKKPRVERAH
jgi:CheY-like chemotaxis protein